MSEVIHVVLSAIIAVALLRISFELLKLRAIAESHQPLRADQRPVADEIIVLRQEHREAMLVLNKGVLKVCDKLEAIGAALQRR